MRWREVGDVTDVGIVLRFTRDFRLRLTKSPEQAESRFRLHTLEKRSRI